MFVACVQKPCRFGLIFQTVRGDGSTGTMVAAATEDKWSIRRREKERVQGDEAFLQSDAKRILEDFNLRRNFELFSFVLYEDKWSIRRERKSTG